MSQEVPAAVLIIFQTLPHFTEVPPDRCWHFLLPSDQDKDRRGGKKTQVISAVGVKITFIFERTESILLESSGTIRIMSMLFLVSMDQRHRATEEDNKSVDNSVSLQRESNSNSFGKVTKASIIVTNKMCRCILF